MADFPDLVSGLWKDNARLQLARDTKFHSMKQGFDDGTEAVQLLQKALFVLDGNPILFFGKPGVLGGTYGPYSLPATEFNQDDASQCHFGTFTRKAIEDVQRKNFIDIDGKAGHQTLGNMDEALVVFFDSLAVVPTGPSLP